MVITVAEDAPEGGSMVKLRDRTLKVGDDCVYMSVIFNGTGSTYGECTVVEVIDQDKKIYRVKERDIVRNNPREWVVQDIDHEAEMMKIGNELTTLCWLANF